MSKAAAFLHGADIHSKEQFQSYREKLNQEIQLCDTQIKELQQQLSASNDPAENEALVHQLDRLHQQQQNFAEQKRLCKIVAQQQVQDVGYGTLFTATLEQIQEDCGFLFR